MSDMNNTQVIKPAIISDLLSYWAMHFCSVIETLYEHKQLKYDFRSVVPGHTVMTFASYIGTLPQSAFENMSSYIRNWGMQYLMAHYLTTSSGKEIVNSLINTLIEDDIALRNVSQGIYNYGVYVTGSDSYVSSQVISNIFSAMNAVVYGFNPDEIFLIKRNVNQVDLSIAVDAYNSVKGVYETFLLFGEVEGNYGARVTKNNFWMKKSQYCHFGIGVLDVEEPLHIVKRPVNNRWVPCLMIGSDYHVLKDFHRAMGIIELITTKGRNGLAQIKEDSINYILEVILDHYHHPIEVLINKLRSLIVKDDAASLGVQEVSDPQLRTKKAGVPSLLFPNKDNIFGLLKSYK